MTPSPALHTVALAAVPGQPWRNGGGTTRELLAWPAGVWRVRVSVARIAQDGPFSAYPGVRRCFAVLAGAGVVLDWPTHRHALTPGDEPLTFDGAAPPHCTLPDGPTDDLNLMLRGAGAMRPAQRLQPWAPPGAAWRGLFTRSALRLRTGPAALELPADTLAWAASETRAWVVEAAGDAIGQGVETATGPLQAWWLHLEEDRR